MAKLYTPAMAKIEAKKARELKKHHGKEVKSSPAKEAWKRLIRNKLAVIGMIVMVLLIILAIIAPLIIPVGYEYQDYDNVLRSPCAEFPFGTDGYGRDIFSRVLYGTRISIPIGFACVIAAFAIGGTLGAVAAYCGGNVDNVIMRIMDIFQSIPSMLLAIAVSATLGGGVRNLIIAIAVSTMPARARVVRASILTVKRNDYIESARAMGASSRRQLLKYMLPNAIGPILTAVTFSVATAILTVSSLSYIGLGISEPLPEWGAMLASGKAYLSSAPYILVFPGVAVMITVLALNVFGDGLRDALDPRLK